LHTEQACSAYEIQAPTDAFSQIALTHQRMYSIFHIDYKVSFVTEWILLFSGAIRLSKSKVKLSHYAMQVPRRRGAIASTHS
jgi:hypothetical protein